MRVAFFSPLRPVASGISDYSEELLPHLADGAELTLFVDGYEPTNLLLRRQFPIYDYRELPTLHRERPFDVFLYHMGNHLCHRYIYELLGEYPGVVVLHDTVLHHFLGQQLEAGDLAAYLDAFPEEGPSLVRRRSARIWSNLDNFAFPGIRRVAERSLAMIVHSETARRAVLQALPAARVTVVRHHWGPLCSPYAGLPPEEIKSHLGFAPDTFLIVSPGIVTPSRRIPESLRCFAILLNEFPHARFVVAGPDSPAVRIDDMVRRMGLDGLVRVTGFVDVPTFQSYLLAADAIVNLRYPLAGETSGGLVRALGMGKAVLISNAGQYAEFPDDCCLKVDPGANEQEMALAYLSALARDPELGRRIGERARRYVQEHHAIERSAQGYLEVMARVLAEKPQPPAGLGRADDGDVQAIVERLRREAAQGDAAEGPGTARSSCAG